LIGTEGLGVIRAKIGPTCTTKHSQGGIYIHV